MADRFREIVETCAVKASAHVVDYGVRGERGTRVIEVFVDSETGVTTELCSSISRAITAAADEEHIVQDGYRLEVSSPGIDRPLRFPWQYAKHVGRKIALSVHSDQGIENCTGVLVGTNNEGLTLESGKKKDQRRVPFPQILEARILPPW